ncbi:Ufm1-specific protease 2 [Mactra antiquata]
MATSIVVHQKIADLLLSGDDKAKFLLGYLSNDEINVVACSVLPDLKKSEVTIKQIRCLLPGGVDIVGIAACGSNCLNYEAYWGYIGDSSAYLNLVKVDGKMNIQDAMSVDKERTIKDLTLKITSDILLSKCLLARIKCTVPLCFTIDTGGKTVNHLQSEINRLIEDLISERTMFHLVSTNVLLGTTTCNGVTETARCDTLTSLCDNDEYNSKSKKKMQETLKCVKFDVYTDLSMNNSNENCSSCSPVINYSTETTKLVKFNLPIDTVAIFPDGSVVADMAEVMCDSLKRQLKAMEGNIIKYNKDDKFYVPVPHHFQPLQLSTLYTVLQPYTITEDELETERKELHQLLCLPVDRPLFRSGNQYRFPDDDYNSGYLVNVHQYCPKSKVSDGTQYLVQGLYTYHHYMQDRFDDNKWGCAYRSLQTLASWFKLQSYVTRDVPSHKEIQQTLVDIGDKDPKFVGSKKWIGSMEVSFVLDSLYGVTSKILNVSSGADLSSKGRDLAAHFTNQGTPIMIGGGVLAHTILGIDYNEVTGDINFLILDPHYTGAEDLKTIIDKGWCGWKDSSFWDKNAHYNLCMPQRPIVI